MRSPESRMSPKSKVQSPKSKGKILLPCILLLLTLDIGHWTLDPLWADQFEGFKQYVAKTALKSFAKDMGGLLGAAAVYYFSERFWKNKNMSALATFVFVTSLGVIYFSRTPMYDWPAAVFYFIFSGFYYLYLKEQKNKYLFISLYRVFLSYA